MTALVIIEYAENKLNVVSQSAITAAQQMSEVVDVCIFGNNSLAIINDVQKIPAVNQIFVFNHSIYNHGLAEPCADAIVNLYEQSLNTQKIQSSPITHIVAASSTFGKNLLPRIAAKLNVSQVSDIIAVINVNTYKRFLYAGNAIATVKSNDIVQVVTVRATAFAATEVHNQHCKHAASILLDYVSENIHSKFISTQAQPDDEPNLLTADIVISGGRGLGNADNFDRLRKIARRLGAAVGATRAAVDAGLAPNEMQVGQTGQIVAPKLYIAVGISGALQHLAGMKESKVIVAINKDPDAPIFQVADYGLVADVTKVLIEWEGLLGN